MFDVEIINCKKQTEEINFKRIVKILAQLKILGKYTGKNNVYGGSMEPKEEYGAETAILIGDKKEVGGIVPFQINGIHFYLSYVTNKFVVGIIELLEDDRISSFIRMTLESLLPERLLYQLLVWGKTTLFTHSNNCTQLRKPCI